ncbi:MAG: short-chain dehydrogenase, partial [Acidimicrobiia bacterium]|nr:short-chain dehydrogenase [Acidimicrobiia bacterium]
TAHELAPHGVSVVSLWPGFVRTERIDVALEHGALPASLDVTRAESPRFTGRAVARLAADPDRQRYSGQAVASRDLADEYGFTDVDGLLPDGPLHDR